MASELLLIALSSWSRPTTPSTPEGKRRGRACEEEVCRKAMGWSELLMPRTEVGKALDCQAEDERRLLAGALRLGRLAVCVLLLVEVVRPQPVEAPRHAARLGVDLGGHVALSGPARLALGVDEGELPRLEVVALLQAARELATQGRAVQSSVSGVRMRMVCGWRGEGESDANGAAHLCLELGEVLGRRHVIREVEGHEAAARRLLL
eukprot:3626309-Prymnesium_polylepis.2